MPFAHSVTDDFVHIQWYGVLTREDFRAIGALMPMIAAQMQRAPHVLHTFDNVTGDTLKPIDAYEHSLKIEDARMGNKVKSAVVTRTPKAYAMAALLKDLNRNPNFLMEIFPSEAKAIAWLCADEEGAAEAPPPAREQPARETALGESEAH